MTARRVRSLAMAVAFAGALTMGVAACGDDESTGGGSSSEAPPTTPVKAGLVSDIGKFNDRSFNQSALEGLQRAETELGADGLPVESKAQGDYVPNLSKLAREKYDVSISVGFLLADATAAAAKQFPDQQFAIVDYSVMAPPFTDAEKGVETPANVRGLTFATNENSYQIGYMAAKMAEADGGKAISAVGGLKIPTVDIFIAGYKAGAEAAVPGIKVDVDYSQDFVAQAKCKELAIKQIDAGSKAVFQVAGGCGLGALDAAKEAGVWGIGVDRDQAFLGDHILTSAVKRVDVSVFDTVKDAQAGTLVGGTDKTFNLANDGVALGKINAKVPAELVTEVEGLKEKIVSGEITPPTTVE
jgi:basic membrane protein A and related proteins